MDLLWKDIRYALHSLRANPGFALVSILTLALGIGATTAIFSVVNAVLLRPLPLPNAQELVMVWERTPEGKGGNFVSPANFVAWTREKGIFASMGCSADWKVTITGQGEPEEVRAGLANRTFFPTLAVKPYLGRTISGTNGKEYIEGQYVVLSYAFWQRKFGADPKVIGKGLMVAGDAYTIVGVMPRDFFVPESRAEMWIPHALPANEGPNRGRYLKPLARLAPGVTLQQAQARMAVVARRLSDESPRYNKGYGVDIVPFMEQVVGNVRRPLLVVMAAVALLLLIACVNIANLLLSRATSRSKEMAVRAALGASRGRLIAQSLTESMVLALVAAVLGILIAGWATMLLVRFTPESAMMPRMTEISVNGRVLAVTTMLTLVTAVLFGLAPALQASRANLQTALKSSSRGSSGDRRGKAFRKALVVVEVALATVLLIGAGLMIKSFAKLAGVDSGVRADSVLTAHIVLPRQYREPERSNAIVAQIFERTSRVPGVTRVGLINNMPFTNWISSSSFTIDGDPVPPEGQEPGAHFRTVGGDYYRVMGMPIFQGRVFDARDRADSPVVFVVNDVFAHQYFEGRSVVGRRLSFEWDEMIHGEIIGVVGSVRAEGLEKDAEAAIYRVSTQDPVRQFTLVVASSVKPESLQRPVTNAIRSLDPLIPVSDVATLDDLISGTIARPRFNTTILSLFAALGLLLASIGIYGVLAYSVAQRTHEMGIRMALGANPADVLRLVVKDGVTVAALGVLVGVAVALPATRVLAALLYGVQSWDAMVFASVAATLSGVALAAAYLPARRATRVDPMVALRPE